MVCLLCRSQLELSHCGVIWITSGLWRMTRNHANRRTFEQDNRWFASSAARSLNCRVAA